MRPLVEICGELTPATLCEAVATAGGAFYLISPDRLAFNCNRLVSSMRMNWPNSYVAYSYKTNYGPPLIAAASTANSRHEVVSFSEYALARKLGATDEEIIFNGPGKCTQVLEAMAARPVTIIVDSYNELQRLADIRVRNGDLRARLGIRLAPSLSFQAAPSRFGVELSNDVERDRVRRLIDQAGLSIQGIHLHFTGARDACSFEERLESLVENWARLGFGVLRFIDCGGGFSSEMPLAVRKQLPYATDTLEVCGEVLGSVMKRLVKDPQVELLVEPGTGILADAGVFITPVLDVKETSTGTVAVVDGTVFCVNPLRSSINPSVLRVPLGSERAGLVPPPVRVCGNSCMETDTLVSGFHESVAVGDVLIFAQKGAYADSMATPFIQGIPALMALNGDAAISLIRPRTTCSIIHDLYGVDKSAATTNGLETLRA